MMPVQHDPIPPNNLEAEMALLGAVLVDRDLLLVVAPIVRSGDFYAHVHATIFEAMITLDGRNEPIDKITLAEELKKRGKLEVVGGLPYLSSLMDTVQTASTARYYAKVVREKSSLRSLIGAGTKIVQLGYEGEDDAAQAFIEADRLIRMVTESGILVRDGRTTSDAVKRVLTAMQTGVDDAQRTPWPTLDRMCGGFFPGELIAWPALPKIGKTGVMLDLADYIAAHYGQVAFFTLEMAIDALTRRYLALYSGISARRQRINDLHGSDWERLSDAMQIIAERPIQFFWRPQSISTMRAALARVTRQSPVKALIVDHVGFLDDAEPRRGETVAQAMDRTYKALLGIAAEYGCVVHVVQHLNNEAEKRGEPGLAFIRNGGNLWGNANAVIFPHRPDPQSADKAQQRRGRFIVAANRDGEEGAFEVEYTGYRHLWAEPGQSPWFEMVGRSAAG